MDYHLPSFSKFVWTFRTSSVAMRRRLRIFTVVMLDFSGLLFEGDASRWFDLFIINYLSDSNDNDRYVTTTTTAFILFLLLVLRLPFLLFFFYNIVASSTLLFLSCIDACIEVKDAFTDYYTHTHSSMLNRRDSKRQHLWRFSFFFVFRMHVYIHKNQLEY